MVQQIRFNGLLNLDDRDELIDPGCHKNARNIRFFGTSRGLSAQNVPGNVLIPNASLPSGTNTCIGSFYDPVRKRLYFFNFNSNGNNGIYYYSLYTGVITAVFICGTNSATDILTFDLNYPVHSAAIVYRQAGDGDLLYWTDELNRPRYINIDTVSAMSPFTEDMINAGKNAPLVPPSTTYKDDTTVTVNNLRKQLFQFCYRWRYKNLEKSTTSPYSKLALPPSGYTPDVQNDPTLNNNIEVTFRTGNSDFKAVEILGRVNTGTSYSDWFSVVTLDRDVYGYNADTNYTFSFYNDSVYTTIDPKETNLYFSYLPDKANTLESLNGNVIIYGGITDGYPITERDEIDVTVTTGVGSSGFPSISTIVNPDNTITIQIGSVVTNGTIYTVIISYDTGGGPAAPKIFTYTATVPPDTQTAVSSAIELAIIADATFNAGDIGGGVVIVSAIPLSGVIFTGVSSSVSAGGAENSGAAWDLSCSERLGLIYFDDRSKTNGVISFVGDATDANDFAVTTPDFDTVSNVVQVPFLAASINHTPPTWATSYQWVRASLTPKLLYWITNDYDTDSDFLYICIQNLLYTQTKISGYVPSYDFEKGDRIKILASFDSGTGFYTPYNLQLDMEIVGVVTNKTMHSPASPGLFIKVAKPTTFPSAPYQANMLVKLYTPYLRQTDTQQIFYEWGERYAIYTSAGNRYHRGQLTDQTAVQPATFQWFDGDIYSKLRTFYLDVNASSTITVFVLDQNYSDYFLSQVNSNGRGWVIDPNTATLYRSNQVRWGQSYIQDTNINQLNIFYANDFDTYDLSRGPIRRFKARDRIVRVFQERGCGQVGVYAKFIQDSGGTNILETSDTIITTNNIQYYQGEFGLSNQPCSLVSGKNQDYFCDPVRGYQLRLSDDGLTPISELYKGQFTIRNLILPYGSPVQTTTNILSKIMGAYNYFDEEYICVLQEISNTVLIPYTIGHDQSLSSTAWVITFIGTPKPGDVLTITVSNGTSTQVFTYTATAGQTRQDIRDAMTVLINATGTFATAVSHNFPPIGTQIGLEIDISTGTISADGVITLSPTVTQSPNTFSFNEKRNGYCSFFDYFPEWIASMDDLIVSFKNGNLYTHNSSTYANFYGSQFDAYIDVPFNNDIYVKKYWLALTEVASTKWDCPTIYTNSFSYGTQRQDSKLIVQNLAELEGQYSSSFLRDINSRGGWVNGDYLKGGLIVVRFRKENASQLVTLNEVSVLSRESPLTSQ